MSSAIPFGEQGITPAERSARRERRPTFLCTVTAVLQRPAFTSAEWLRLAGFYGVVALLHIVGWGLFLSFSWRYPSLVGLGLAAYMFGVRHAFDADHIAAVDDTVRYLMQKGGRPLGIGFFFSLGHSTVVFIMAVATILAASLLRHHLPAMHDLGGIIGAVISGSFLWLIGMLNLMVLLNIISAWKRGNRSGHQHAHIEELLGRRGLLNRLLGRWAKRLLNHSWQMFPLGILFGLGFDTASEIGLLASTAGASATGTPLVAVLSLPILFAAGMTMLDTTDGVLMSKVYSWALVNPLRKIYYNIVVTSLSIAVALVIGTIEWLQVIFGAMHSHGRFISLIGGLDFAVLGYIIFALFLLAWGISAAVWRFTHLGERDQPQSSQVHLPEHMSSGGLRQVHNHLH